MTLEPDEILLNTPAPLEGQASGPLPIFWRGKERQFWFRIVELFPKNHFVFVSEIGSRNTGNWLVYERGDMYPATRALTPPHRKIENLVLNWNSKTHGLGRFFVVRGKRNKVSCLLGDDGEGVWLARRFEEKIGHPTQNPLELIERLVLSSVARGRFGFRPRFAVRARRSLRPNNTGVILWAAKSTHRSPAARESDYTPVHLKDFCSSLKP